MKPILLLLFVVYLLVSPFYFFKSGMPQPADILLSIGFLFFLWKIEFRHFFNKKPFTIAIAFLSLIALVAIANQTYLYVNEISGNTLYPVLFYLFNFLSFSYIVYLSQAIDRKKLFYYTSIVLLSTIAIQFLLAVFEIQNVDSNWVKEGNRFVLFFNNPNQLGYFSLLVLTLFIVIPSAVKKNKWVLLAMVLMTFYLALVSQSRIVVIGILYLALFIASTEFVPYTKKKVFMLLLVFGAGLVALNTNFIKEKLTTIKTRSAKRSTSLSGEINTRGFDRMYKHPIYLLIGAGEGANSRFSAANKELHSGFGTMLFSYGIIGFLLFMYLLYLLVSPNLVYYSFLLLPIFLYNLVHQGFRNTLFWVLLGFLFSISLTSRDSF